MFPTQTSIHIDNLGKYRQFFLLLSLGLGGGNDGRVFF